MKICIRRFSYKLDNFFKNCKWMYNTLYHKYINKYTHIRVIHDFSLLLQCQWGHAVAQWSGTALQTGRSQDQFPIVSL
jgi:hypothetical protein